MGQVAVRQPLDLDAACAQVRETIKRYRYAPETLKEFTRDWERFSGWCEDHGCAVFPTAPETIALYAIEHYGLTVEDNGIHLERRSSTFAKLLLAIRYHHHQSGVPSPTETPLVRSVAEVLDTAHQPSIRKAKPLRLNVIEAIAAHPPSNQTFTQDWTLLCLGFFGAFRGAELPPLRTEDIFFGDAGMVVTLRHSKENQLRELEHVPIARRPQGVCPVEVLERWVDGLPPNSEWLFPSRGRPDKHISVQVVRAAVKRVTNGGKAKGSPYSSHSMRRGFCTEAIAQGQTLTMTARKARHRSLRATAGYVAWAEPDLAPPMPLRLGGPK